jgi:hypothetical protein
MVKDRWFELLSKYFLFYYHNSNIQFEIIVILFKINWLKELMLEA